ncbi:MAG TPA: HEAT repeat domain-containing protein [Pyrinomonadaceae bacterium]|nr:HEAT repeat domain-containing protein [Pyrinomonadaceae bacterium]
MRGRKLSTRARRVVVLAACLCVALAAHVTQLAQRKREGVNVTGVASSTQGGNSVVSISGDGAMSHAQTWQDKDGTFNVVVPYGKTSLPSRGAGGVRVERVGDSLHISIPAKRGSSVTVRPNSNRLDLVIAGGVADGGEEKAAAPTRRERARAGEASRDNFADETAVQQGSQAPRRERAFDQNAQRTQDALRRADAAQSNQPPPTNAQDKSQAPPPQGVGDAAQSAPAPDAAEGFKAPETSGETSAAPAASMQVTTDAAEGGELFVSTASLVIVLFVFGGGLAATLFFVNRRRAQKADADDSDEAEERPSRSLTVRKESSALVAPAQDDAFETPKGDRRQSNVPVAQDRRATGKGAEDQNARFVAAYGGLVSDPKPQREESKSPARAESKSDVRGASSALPAVLFGAYRISEEIGKLVEGLPHSIEVLASRASDDRRAIETSLIKVLDSPEVDEDGKRRARRALEEYGFVARQSAALLLAQDTYDRLSAARVLRQVCSRASLPFLLEALFDNDSSVRAEVVASLGALGLPRALGALLDTARRYPDVPTAVIGPALTACSFEAIEMGWSATHDGRSYNASPTGELAAYDAAAFEPPAERLPEWLEDENFADALERLESADVEARIAAAQSLSRFRAARSVEALARMLERDESAAVRAAAVTSLGAIDHESVFAPVLLALADDSREVRAAAARAFSGLEFDRADACARTVETADAATLAAVAAACVKSGLAAQSLLRLAGEDRRHAFEAFSLLSMVAHGGESRVILDAVAGDRDHNVRLAAVRLAGLACVPELSDGLRELVARGGLPEAVRAAILEAVGAPEGSAA